MEDKLILEPGAIKEDIVNARHIWELGKGAPAL